MTFVQLIWPPELVLLMLPLEEPVELVEPEELVPVPDVPEVLLLPLDPVVLLVLDPEVLEPDTPDPEVVRNEPVVDVELPPDAVPPPSAAPQTQLSKPEPSALHAWPPEQPPGPMQATDSPGRHVLPPPLLTPQLASTTHEAAAVIPKRWRTPMSDQSSEFVRKRVSGFVRIIS
jgi:hypothetical protein